MERAVCGNHGGKSLSDDVNSRAKPMWWACDQSHLKGKPRDMFPCLRLVPRPLEKDQATCHLSPDRGIKFGRSVVAQCSRCVAMGRRCFAIFWLGADDVLSIPQFVVCNISFVGRAVFAHSFVLVEWWLDCCVCVGLCWLC